MGRGLSIHGRLAITIQGHRIILDGGGDHVVIEAPSRGALWALIQHRPQWKSRSSPQGESRRANGADAGMAQVITDLLERGDLTVSVRLAGTTVARAGVGARPSWLSRLVGLGAIEVRPTSAILALWKGKASPPPPQ